MSSQKPEAETADQDDGDHTQPINLVAQRAPVPVTTFTGPSSQSSVIPPVTMRTHVEPPKSGLMNSVVFQTLYFRTPTATRQPGPVMAAQVAPGQHFTTKSGFKGFKSVKVNYYQDKTTEKSGSEFNIKVIRMPTNDASQSPGVASTQPTASGSLSTAMMPSTMSSNANRHVPTAVHSVIASGSSSTGPMASIIRGAQQVSQTGHMQQPYQCHVPRGPAAVASISAAPKSAVATPILRTPHSSATMTLASASSMMSSHQPVRQARSPILLSGSRLSTPSVSVVPPSTLSQVIDLQKGSVGHSLSTNPVQIGLNPRALEGTSIRTGHPSSITITKPINISQPIVQHLHQVSEKSFSKSLSSSTSVASSNTIPAHQSSGIITSTQSSGTDALTVGVPTITRTASSALAIPPSNMYSSTVIPLPNAAPPMSQHVVPTLRPSLVHPQSVHALSTTGGPVAPQPTYTVISAKTSLPPSNHTMSLVAPSARTAPPSSSVVVTTGPISTASVLSVAATRPLNTPNSVCQTAIPVAKVYPQPLPAVQSNAELSIQDNTRNAVFGTQSQQISSCATSGPITAVATTTVSSTPQAVMVSEKRNESTGTMRFTSLTKAPAGSGAPYSLPSAYFYEPFSSGLAMHYPGNVSTSNQNFSSSVQSSQSPRSGSFSQHGSSNLTPSIRPSITSPANPVAPVQPLNSLMVTVEPTHRQNSKHPPYNIASGGLSNSDIAQTSCATSNPCTLTNSSNTSVGLISTSMVSTNYNSVQSQGSVSNHNTSPRPSILRKRTSDAMNSITKKNLMATSYALEPVSPRPDIAPSISSSAPSPKPLSEQLKENGTTNTLLESEKISGVGGSLVTIKKEPGVFENNLGPSNGDNNINSIPVEASPRKKPRKQLFSPEKYRLKNISANNGAVSSEFIETHSSDGEDEFERDNMLISKEGSKSEEENVKWVTFCKRPTMSLINSYRHGWKSRNNHFMKYTDVKAKEEKKTTINDLANQKDTKIRVNPWKVVHLSGQFDDVIKLESNVYSRLSQLLEFIEDSSHWKTQLLNQEDDKLLNKLNDLTKGNLQRSKLAQEQMIETKTVLMKAKEHDTKIVEVLNKYVSKRPLKKKEKT